MVVFALVLKITVALLTLIAAFEDFRHLRIRNDLCIGIALLFVPFAFSLGWHDTLPHLACFLIVFVVTAVLFFFNLFGGGDAKLLSALALWLDFTTVLPFFFIMALAGGVLAFIAVIAKKTGFLQKIAARAPALIGPDDGWPARLAAGESVVPYGIAICIAALVTLF